MALDAALGEIAGDELVQARPERLAVAVLVRGPASGASGISRRSPVGKLSQECGRERLARPGT